MPVSNSKSLIVVKDNATIDREEREAARRSVEAAQNNPVVLSLASFVRRCWDAARQAKEPHKKRMLEALRRRAGEYSQEKLQAIRQEGGSEIYMMLTDEKCNAAESWIEDILTSDEKPWGIKPTPDPEIPPDKQMEFFQQAKEEATRKVNLQIAMMQEQRQAQGAPMRDIPQEIIRNMLESAMKEALLNIDTLIREEAKKQNDQLETELNDHIVESNWTDALIDTISDIVTFPAGIIKGPVVKQKTTLQWVETQNGLAVATPQTVLQKFYECVSPLDIYPAPSSIDIEDGFLIEKHVLTRADLVALKGVKGYDSDAIDQVLTDYGRGGLRQWLWVDEMEREQIQGREYSAYDPEAKIEALQFWGSVQGLMLLEWGMDPELIPDPMEEYAAEVWLIGSYVIKAELNGDPLGRKPYFKTSFRRRNGQFWGMGLPELIADSQDACNAAARNLINNMALASGPMVGIDVGAFADGEQVSRLRPWKIWQFDMARFQVNKQPIWFFQPNPLINELIAVYDKFSVEADNKSGIPKYSYGAEAGSGAAKTASGFSMMMSNTSRGIKKVLKNIDRDIIKPSILRLHEWLMINDAEYSGQYHGDIKIQSKGSSVLLVKEQQQVRRNEFLQILLSSPAAQEIVGIPGIAEVLREIVKGLDIGLVDIVPDKQELRQRQQQKVEMQQYNQSAVGQAGPEGSAGGAPPYQKGVALNHDGSVASGADTRTMPGRQ